MIYSALIYFDNGFELSYGIRPTPRFTRAGQVWVWSRGAVNYGADVVGGCKELSAGEDSCLCLTNLSARILYSRRRMEKQASRRRVQQFVGQFIQGKENFYELHRVK